MNAETLMGSLWLATRGIGWAVTTTEDRDRYVTRVKRGGLVYATIWHGTHAEATTYHAYRSVQEEARHAKG